MYESLEIIRESGQLPEAVGCAVSEEEKQMGGGGDSHNTRSKHGVSHLSVTVNLPSPGYKKGPPKQGASEVWAHGREYYLKDTWESEFIPVPQRIPTH